MRRPRSANRRVLLIAVPAVALLAAGSTVAFAASQGAFDKQSQGQAVVCTVPTLAGATVDVTLLDVAGMGGMMSGGQSGWRQWQPGMLRVAASPATVAHGPVSLQVFNEGVVIHELVVLPLAPRQEVGARGTGQDGRVAEDGSVGEASNDCAADSGEGITAGGSGWTTLSLPAGRYELLCNLPGHYHAGMFAELDVS